MSRARSKVLGPFDVFNNASADCNELVSIPYADVEGSQIICSVLDNFNIQTVTTLVRFWAAAEIAIYGLVQGYETCLKRQHTRMLSGPCLYTFDYAQAFDTVSIRGRNLSGGQRGAPSAAPTPTVAAGFQLKVQVHIQPRGGMGPAKLAHGNVPW